MTAWLVDPLKRPTLIGDSIETVQDDVASPAPVQTDKSLITSDFASSGYAIARSNWDSEPADSTYLVLMGGYHSKTHKHRDDLSFEWFEQGHKRISDSGKYGYWADERRAYVLSSRAHNSVEIEDFDIYRMSPYGSIIKGNDLLDADTVEMKGSLEYRALSHRRKLTMRRARWLIVDDELSFVRRRQATQWFHLGPDHRLNTVSGNKARFEGPDGIPLVIEALGSGVRMVVYNGDCQASQGFISTNDDQFEASFAVGFIVEGTNHRIVTILGLGDDAQAEGVDHAVFRQNAVIETPHTRHASQPSPIGEPVQWSFLGLDAMTLHDGLNSYSMTVPGDRVTFVANHDEDAKEMLVLLDGHDADSSSSSWNVDDLAGANHAVTTLAFQDPTTTRFQDVRTGFFLGDEEHDGLHLIERVVRMSASGAGIQEESISIVGWGASAFAALKLGDSLKKARIVAVDPEPSVMTTDLIEPDQLLGKVFPDWQKHQLELVYRRRLELSAPSESRTGATHLLVTTGFSKTPAGQDLLSRAETWAHTNLMRLESDDWQSVLDVLLGEAEATDR